MTARHERGVALLVALLVVALATVLLAMLLDTAGAALGRTRTLTRGTQADAYAIGLEDWAIDMLRRDATSSPIDTRADAWAQPLPRTDVPGGHISATMVDLNGCFNLNVLAAADGQVEQHLVRLQRLLASLRLDPDLAFAVADWVDADFQPAMRGAEDQAYLSRSPPYRAANRPFADVSELRLVRGFDRDTLALVLPHVCALPSSATLINVNTASVPVLMSLHQSITEPIARRLAGESGAQYSSGEAFVEALRQAGIEVPAVEALPIAIDSRYFLARAEIELDGIPIAYATMISRDTTSGSYRVIARNRAL